MDCFNKPISRLNTSSSKWNFADENMLSFSIADSDYPTSKAIIKIMKKRCDHGIFGYTIIDDEYRSIIANWVKKRYNYSINKEWIVPTAGIVPSIALAIDTFTKEGDYVVIQPPVYNPFYAVIENTKRQVLLNKLICNNNHYEMDFVDLEQHFKNGAKMMILCSPHNPVGRVWKKEELDKLVELCHQYQVFLFSDEIHCDFILYEQPFISLGQYIGQLDHLIIGTAPSKTFNLAGLKTSNLIIGNQEVRQKYLEQMTRHFSSSPNLMGIVACKAAYSHGEAWLEKQLDHLRKNHRFATIFLQTYLPQIAIAKLEGTYLLWLDLRFLKMKGTEICDGLKALGMIVNEGQNYGKECNGFIRVNIACPQSYLEKGLKILQNFILLQEKQN
ncbi:MAG: MalY/PatB family protein [Bacilli bacterium]